MRKIIAAIFLFLNFNSFSQSIQDSIQREIDGALLFLQQTQKQETVGYDYWKGEWGSTLENIQASIYFGNKGKNFYDSNCFSTATVHNILANIYLQNQKYILIPPMLQLAEDCISTYEKDGSFSFWHAVPPSPNLIRKKNKNELNGMLVLRPNHYPYNAPFANRYANVPSDADDTALGYLAYYLGNEVAKVNSAFIPKYLPVHLDSLFGRWRDTRKVRRSISYYNYSTGSAKRTGAFLTWFQDEGIYTPFTIFFPRRFKPNLPLMSNEIDCVVGANVLRTLSYYHLLHIDGVKETYAYLTDALQSEKRCLTCGNYYPTEFSSNYAVSQAIVSGVDSLKKNIPFMTAFILSKQENNGGWKSWLPDNDIQSSVYALLTLLNVGDYRDAVTKNAIDKGIQFIRSRNVEAGGGIYWKGGIYFSGGTVTRETQVWKSDAVTTALCLEALVKYQQILILR